MTTSLHRAAPLVLALLTMTAACGGASRVGRANDDAARGEDFERSGNKPIESVLQEKVSGVTVTRTNDGSLAVQIRGGGSLTGDDAPLYILDNLPFQPGPGGALTGVDPYSIESIRVLKGPEAVIYGVRGFNGVILITTKKGGRR